MHDNISLLASESSQIAKPIDCIHLYILNLANMAAIINWEGALEQVAGDEEFLNEVLADLLTESDTAEADLASSISSKNLDGVMKAAHRIKGSASYLCCDRLRDISLALQDLGHTGAGVTDAAAIDAILVNVNAKYVIFKKTLVDLRAAVKERLANA